MNTRTLLVLTILVAAMAAFIFFYEKDALSTDERTEQAKKVLVFEQDEVRAVEIAWEGNEVRLERQEPEKQDGDDDEDEDLAEAEWRLLAPLEARAARTAVDDLLRSLGDLEKERTLEDADRSALGFDEPRARLTLTADDGETVLEIGAEVPGSSDILVAVAGRGEAYQVSDSLWSDLTKEPGDWRDKKLFTASRSEIDRLTLTAGDAKVLLAQRGDDFWIESPLADLADEDLVNGLMGEITGLAVETFLDAPEASPAELGLDPAASELELVLAGRDEPFRIELGHVKPEGEDTAAEGASQTLYARCENQLVEIKTRLAESLARPAAQWRSRNWSPVQVFRVETARLKDAEGTLEVTREDNDWLRGEDRVAYSTVSDVLYAISDAKAEQVVSREEAEGLGHSFAEPALAVMLGTEGDSHSLTLYPAVEGLSAATREGREAVLLLPSDAVGELTAKLAELRTAEPLPEEEEEDGEEDGVDESE